MRRFVLSDLLGLRVIDVKSLLEEVTSELLPN